MRSDDTTLAAAVLARALANGWNSIVAEYVKQHPKAAEDLKDLAKLRKYQSFDATIAYAEAHKYSTASRPARTEVPVSPPPRREPPRPVTPTRPQNRTPRHRRRPLRPVFFYERAEGTLDVTERTLRAVKAGEKAPAKRAPRKVGAEVGCSCRDGR